MIIRPYQKSDKEKALDLCDEFWTKNFGAKYPFDREHTSQKFDLFMHEGACFVLDDLSGLILLAVNTLPCNPAPVAADVMWYVSEKSRGGAGRELLQTAIRYCELCGIKELSMAHMQSSAPEIAESILTENGFVLKETTFVRSI